MLDENLRRSTEGHRSPPQRQGKTGAPKRSPTDRGKHSPGAARTAVGRILPQCIRFMPRPRRSIIQISVPDYAYKEAALNPMNLRDRTVEWEADIVNIFIKTPAKAEFFGHRETPEGTSLYYSAPIRVDNDSCLACHGTPGNAPPEMVKLMGPRMGSVGSS